MRLGVCTSVYADLPLEAACAKFSEYNIKNLEIYSGENNNHLNVGKLLKESKELERVRGILETYDMTIGSLNAAGNPVHPDKEIREKARKGFSDTVRLAEKMGIHTVTVFSGTPGGCKGDMSPNWVTCPWPGEYLDILKYQWEDVLIPYWEEAARFAGEYGVTQIAFEMHPGFCVYNPETLLRLRTVVGPSIGANLDPSHLLWQGMDILEVIAQLRDCIFSVHAKDVFVNNRQIRKNGVNDGKHYSYIQDRSWTFRTVGYGNGETFWKNFISGLKMTGYDGPVNIEHEDMLLSREEGLSKAADFLDKLLIKEKPDEMWWA